MQNGVLTPAEVRSYYTGEELEDAQAVIDSMNAFDLLGGIDDE